MKLLLLFICTFLHFSAVSQQDMLIDERDNKSYRTIDINNTIWMLDNLAFESDQSFGLNKDQGTNRNLTGRYYHFEELDSVCPKGWEIPNAIDWIDYFKFMIKEQVSDSILKIKHIHTPTHYTLSGYTDSVDLFAEKNILNLGHTGRYEGDTYHPPSIYADFWTIDTHEDFKRRTHIHIMNAWTTIHSHKHHLNPNLKRKLRRFMVRCVKYG